MKFHFPSFADTKCVLLTVCGQLATDESEVIEWLRTQETMEARYQRSRRTGYVYVVFGGKHGRHLHVDAASSDYFTKRRPSPTHKIAQVRAALDRVAGCEINLSARAVYYVSAGDLPPFIQTAMQEATKVQDVSIRTTGGILSVTGAPIDTIRWWLREGDANARVDLETEMKTTLDGEYLETCLHLLDSAFEAFVLQGER